MTSLYAMVKRTVYQKRWFIAGWAVAFGSMSALVMFFFPSFSQGGGFDEVAKSLPEQLQGFIGDPSIFSSLDGFIASQVFDVRMSLLLIIMSLVLATSLSVKDEESGDLRTTLSNSISRPTYVLAQFFAATIIISLLNLASITGIYLGIMGIGENPPHALIAQLGLLSTLLGITAFSIPFSIGLSSGKRSLALAVGLFTALGSYLLTTFSQAVDWLKPWELVSLIHYYDTAGLRDGSFEVLNIGVFFILILVSITAAITLFRNRDIA